MSLPRSASVATLGGAVYWPVMVALRLLQILTLVALLIAPLRIMSAHAEMAMPASAAATAHHAPALPAGHCADMGKPAKEGPAADIDCAIACSVLASAETAVVAHPLAAGSTAPAAFAGVLHGLHPESDPPPPRAA